MGGSASKNKGSSFEREVAGYLSKLYDESFVRCAHSGAYIGGSNQSRKAFLSNNQIKSFKGDIIPPDDWGNFNCECKSYSDFPFNLVLSGNCKILEGWIAQLMDVAEKGDVNLLLMKFNRKGKFVVVQSGLTWITDQFMYYTSNAHNDWLIIEFDHFFNNNRDLLKTYSYTGTMPIQSPETTDTKSTLITRKTISNIVVN